MPQQTPLPQWVIDAADEITALVRKRTGLDLRGLSRQIQLLIVNRIGHKKPTSPRKSAAKRPR